jgi:hypothetical protein
VVISSLRSITGLTVTFGARSLAPLAQVVGGDHGTGDRLLFAGSVDHRVFASDRVCCHGSAQALLTDNGSSENPLCPQAF